MRLIRKRREQRATVVRCAAGLMLVMGLVGCHRQPAQTSPVSIAPRLVEEYCWHTVFQTAYSPDTTAARFERAFRQLGLANAHIGRLADTAWASAGPSVLDEEQGRATYAARVVAYRHGDSTHFRHYVAVGPPSGGAPNAAGGNAPSLQIPFCGKLGRITELHGTAPQWPDGRGEETLSVWRARP